MVPKLGEIEAELNIISNSNLKWSSLLKNGNQLENILKSMSKGISSK